MELPNPISLKKIEMKYNENNINNYPSKITVYGYNSTEPNNGSNLLFNASFHNAEHLQNIQTQVS
jgi:hypothetical protein